MLKFSKFKSLRVLFPAACGVYSPKIALSLAIALSFMLLTPLQAEDFNIGPGAPVTKKQVLVGANNTITIETGGTLSITGLPRTGTAIDARAAGGNTITNNGGITTTGDYSYSIYSAGKGDSINNNGTITTTGTSAYSIYSEDYVKITNGNSITVTATGAMISNAGTIMVSGVNAQGINSDGAGAIITNTNSGRIVATGESAYGIHSTGPTAKITNSGSITTGDSMEPTKHSRSTGIVSSGANATITNTSSGTIRTEGAFSLGINVTAGQNVMIHNRGMISTEGNNSAGIRADGPIATITNSNSIKTRGTFSFGIGLTGTGGKITNSGSIKTTGRGAYGIVSTNADATITITNSGTIETGGMDPRAPAYGIDSRGADAVITNNGSIKTTGTGTHGINLTGANSTFINNGSIKTTGTGAYGIYSRRSGARIINSGSIKTEKSNAFGIRSAAAGAVITNSGSIKTEKRNAYGILSTALNVEITNSGMVTTAGTSAHGIFSNSAGRDAIITNRGIITTTGMSAHGIRSGGAGAVITNSGTIVTTGEEAHGISAYNGSGAEITNSGMILATGEGSYAIKGGANKVTLNVLRGSQIFGKIDLGGDSATDKGTDKADIVNFYGGGVSKFMVFENTEVVNLKSGVGTSYSPNVDDKVAITVDPTAESSRSIVLSSLISSIHGVVGRRMAHPASLKPQQRHPIAWAQVFGGTFERDKKSDVLAYETDHVGFTLGYEQDTQRSRLGLIGGYAYSDTNSADIASFRTAVNHYFLGAYGHFRLVQGLHLIRLTGSILAGYGDHDNERLVHNNINRVAVANADIGSFFLSPSLTVSTAFAATDKIEIRPSVSLDYSVAWMDEYREKGATLANLKVGRRTVRARNAKLQLAAAYQLNPRSEVELRGGINSRHSVDDNVDYSIAGKSFSHSGGENSTTGGFVGATIRIVTVDRLDLRVEVEYAEGDNETSVSGKVGLSYAF